MTTFKIFTSIGNFEEKAENPKEATAMVMKANPGILIKKIKRVKEFGK